MINYHCPDFLYGFEIYKFLFKIQEEHPEVFYDNVKIKSIFGSFPTMTWMGGGYCLLPRTKSIDIQKIVEFYREKNIPLKLTLTNPMLEEIDCYDRYCNTVLTLCENDINEVLVSSPILEDFIRTEYPRYKINHSIIATEQDKTIEEYIKELDKYNTVVLPRRILKNMDLLEQIPNEYRNRFEFLCNDPCDINCPRLYEHYKDFGKAQLSIPDGERKIGCTSLCNEMFPHAKNYNYQIHYDEIVNLYQPKGFTEFKLSGRSDPIIIILTLVPYLIKPKYQRDMYGHLFYLIKNKKIVDF